MHYWFTSYGNFAEWVDFAYRWSFSGEGSASTACAAGLFLVFNPSDRSHLCREGAWELKLPASSGCLAREGGVTSYREVTDLAAIRTLVRGLGVEEDLEHLVGIPGSAVLCSVV